MIHGIANIRPITMARECGGWLAVTPPDAAIRIGVSAATENEARQALATALDRWAAILNDADKPSQYRPVTHR